MLHGVWGLGFRVSVLGLGCRVLGLLQGFEVLHFEYSRQTTPQHGETCPLGAQKQSSPKPLNPNHKAETLLMQASGSEVVPERTAVILHNGPIATSRYLQS